jgi:hypothetical protein
MLFNVQFWVSTCPHQRIWYHVYNNCKITEYIIWKPEEIGLFYCLYLSFDNCSLKENYEADNEETGSSLSAKFKISRRQPVRVVKENK